LLIDVAKKRQDAGFEVFKAVVMNAAIIWDIAPCSPHVDGRFGRTYHIYLQGKKISRARTLREGG
jgi:hypothetical protein